MPRHELSHGRRPCADRDGWTPPSNIRTVRRLRPEKPILLVGHADQVPLSLPRQPLSLPRQPATHAVLVIARTSTCHTCCTAVGVARVSHPYFAAARASLKHLCLCVFSLPSFRGYTHSPVYLDHHCHTHARTDNIHTRTHAHAWTDGVLDPLQMLPWPNSLYSVRVLDTRPGLCAGK